MAQDILTTINDYKKEFVAKQKLNKNLSEIKKEAEQITTQSSFVKKIENDLQQNQIAVIAEIKKASPSKGIIREDFDVKDIATKYAKAGATCLSVLTDEKYFQGHNKYVRLAKNSAKLPILRKDFIIDPYQIYESKLIGADAILLIMASLTLKEAKEYEIIAHDLGLDVLVETHDEKEIEQALQLKTPLIGINNRNLKTLEVSLETTQQLKHLIPTNYIVVCESGIKTKTDIETIQSYKVNSFLIGESLMQQDDIEQALRNLL